MNSDWENFKAAAIAFIIYAIILYFMAMDMANDPPTDYSCDSYYGAGTGGSVDYDCY